MSEAIQVVPKRVRWTSRVGSVSPGLPNIPVGHLYYRGYQKAAGTKKHSGGAGKRGNRFYQGRFRSGNVAKPKKK